MNKVTDEGFTISLNTPLEKISHRLYEFYNQHDLKDISSFFNEKKYTIEDTGNTYKVINDWTRLGVIEDSRDKEGKWRKFSLLDLVWIKVVSHLRSFNFPLAKIKLVKPIFFDETVFKGVGHGPSMVSLPGIKYPELEFYVLAVIIYEQSISEEMGFASKLIIEHDEEETVTDLEGNDIVIPIDTARFMTPSGLGQYAKNYVSFICVDLVLVVREILNNAGITEKLNDTDLEAKNEIEQIPEIIKSHGPIESINLKFKNGSLNMYEVTQRVDEAKINDVLKQSKFQDVEIKQENGKIVYIKRKLKNKV